MPGPGKTASFGKDYANKGSRTNVELANDKHRARVVRFIHRNVHAAVEICRMLN